MATQNQQFNYSNRKLFSGPHLLGVLLLLASVVALVGFFVFDNTGNETSIIAMGIGAAIIGLVIITSYSGTLIDFGINQYQEYFIICRYKTGEWISLPDIRKVKVITKSYTSTNNPNGISPTLSGKVTDFNLLLYANAPHAILNFTYQNEQKVKEDAHKLAASLRAELVLEIN